MTGMAALTLTPRQHTHTQQEQRRGQKTSKAYEKGSAKSCGRNEERVEKRQRARARADSDHKSKRIENAAQVRVQVRVLLPAVTEVVQRAKEESNSGREK